MSKYDSYDYMFKIMVDGETGVGKTNLISRFTKNQFTTVTAPTIGADFTSKTIEIDGKLIKAQLWSTAGQERYEAFFPAYYRNGIGGLLVFDLAERGSFENLDRWLKRTQHYMPKAKIILIGNKSDLTNKREVTIEEAQNYADQNGMRYVETSAYNSDNVEHAFINLVTDVFRTQSTSSRASFKSNDTVKLETSGINCSLECEDEKQRPIHLACQSGNMELVKFLLQNNCSLECEDENKKRPIHLACQNGHLEVVKFLIQSNCELDCRTEGGETPMEIAIKNGKNACVDFLNEIQERRKVFDLVRSNNAQALDAVYSPGIVIMEHPETGFSLLEVALESNANDIIDYILNKSVTAEELSALENFMKNCCRPEAVQIMQECLLYRSIRVHDADGFHLSGLAKTINGHGKLVKASFLEIAVEFGCKAFIHSILKKSIYNDEEWTKAKDLAVAMGHAEIVEVITKRITLLRKRADKNFTWLHSAVCDNDPDMVKYIMQKDLVNPDFNNEVVGTALALGHMMCYEDCIGVLEQFNVDVNTQNKYLQSPLHEAIASGTIDHCSYLISGAKEIDKPGFMGFTGLQCAVIKGYDELCEELVKNGADCVRYVEILQQLAFNKRVLPISKRENAITLCAKIHQKIYPCLLQALDSDKLECSEVQSVINNEIFHVAMPHGDPKILMSLFAKSCPAVQQLVIEDLVDHFASKDNYIHFEDLLNTKIEAPKIFSNGETLLTNLLKQNNLKYSWAVINCESNNKYIILPNGFNETPLQIAIESELFDLITPMILNCDDEAGLDFNWHIPLVSLFQKLSISANNDTDQKLLAAIKTIIVRGGNIYKKTPEGLAIIDCCTRFKERIEKFQKISRPKERDEKNICSVCLDKEVNCALDCGHTFCMDCGIQLYRCPMCKSEAINQKKLYFN